MGLRTFGFVFLQDIWLKVLMGLWAFVYDVCFRVFGLGCFSAFWLRTIGLRPKTIGFVFLQDIWLRVLMGLWASCLRCLAQGFWLKAFIGLLV